VGLFSRSTPNLESIREDIENQTKRIRDVLQEMRDLEVEIRRRFQELEDNQDAQGKAVRIMAEELEERIDRGNKIWRKIRASEYYEKQREDSEEDEQAILEFYQGNGESGPAEELPPVHRGMGHIGSAHTTAREVGQAIARRIAGKA